MDLYFRIFVANLFSAMEYRSAFLMQASFMAVNNAFIVFVWYVFFQKFGTIGGLDFGHYAILQAVMGLTFGIQHLVFPGCWSVAGKIRDGGLDGELLLPGSPLLRILMDRIDVGAVGDVLFSMAVFAFLYSDASPASFVTFLAVGILGGIVVTAFTTFVQTLTFFVGDTDELSGGIFELALSPAMYPPKILENFPLRALFYSLIPTFFIVWLPSELVSKFDVLGFVILLAAAAFFTFIAFFTFKKGLRRYESGNLMGVRR